ncbi:MAG: hypothetical protein LUF68_02240, partial [Clostridiales bacterium]|nr:hypothetical protein [Clostridiales bacterium]
MTSCINSASVSGSSMVGGVVGRNLDTLNDSYNIGTVNSTGDTAGGVVGYNYASSWALGTVENCYYLEGTATAAVGTDNGTSTDVAAKTTTKFASGEVTYLLTGGVTNGTQAWYQTLGSDSYPVLDSTHGTVYYTTTGCDGTPVTGTYSNSSVIHAGGDYGGNGFCLNCDNGYLPAEMNSDGVYEISNAGQLFWFAALVSGDTTQEGITAADTAANAVLLNDITIPDGYVWTPIGTKDAPYTGTFDGGGKTISGMSIKTASTYMGLFGYVSAGTIKDLTVSGKIDVSGETIYAGGIVGTVHNSVLSNLTSNVSVTAEAAVKGTFGGLAASVEGTGDGSAHSTMERCVNYGTVTASGVLDCVGGLTGFMNSATITNCINYGEVDTSGGTAAASVGIYTGGIVGYINNANAYVTKCVNVGEISGADNNTTDACYTGAAVGRIRENLGGITNVYYLDLDTSANTDIGENEYGKEVDITAKNATEFASGEVTWLLQYANSGYVWGQSITGSTTDAYPVLISDE